LDYKKSSDEGLRPEVKDDQSDNFVLNIEYELDNGFVLTSVTGYSAYESSDFQDVDYMPVTWLANGQDEDFDQTSQEFRITSPGGETIDFIAGLYWQDNSLDMDYGTVFGGSGFLDALGFCAPFAALGGSGQCADVARPTSISVDTESWSAFGEVTWNINESFRAAFGLRYMDETRDFSRAPVLLTDANGNALVPGSDEFFTSILLGSLGIVGNTPYDDSRSEDHISPSIKLGWDVNDDVMVYATASRSYKTGGFNTSADALDEFMEYDEEEVTGFELGMKSTLADGAAYFNMAVFYTEFDDMQQSVYNGLGFLVGNAGKSISQGVEIDGKWLVAEGLTIGGSASWLDAYFDENENGQCTTLVTLTTGAASCDLSGEPTTYAPEWSGNLYAEYVRPVGNNLEFRASADMNFSSSYFLDSDLDPVLKQDGYEKYNARVALGSADGVWEVALVGKNLTDEIIAYWGTDMPLTPGSFVAFPEAPRTVAIQARYSF
jgi:outer membrane receptor protein involved in Fe transport